MPEQEPITRVEKFLNGEVGMTPITREEKILAGEDVETITRREYFLKKYRGGGGGDVTVVPLSVTENGTYSEQGVAYSPVIVEVPLPADAHIMAETSEHFDDAEDLPLAYAKVTIENKDKAELYLTSDRVITEDTAPYLYRQSPSASSVSQNIIGGTVAWNQLYNVTQNATQRDVKIEINNGIIKISGTSTDIGTGPTFAWTNFKIPTGHKVIVLKDFSLPIGDYIFDQYNRDSSTDMIGRITNIASGGFLIPQLRVTNSGVTYNITNGHLSVIDLTQMFGSTIADYLYTIDKAEAGSGIAWLKSYGFLTKDYYAYDSGSLQSVNVSSRKVYDSNDTLVATYPLDSDLTLRGIPKLDANNNLYYDGDTYESDGSVTRKYGVVDLGTLTWTIAGSGRHNVTISDGKYASTNAETAKILSSQYMAISADNIASTDMSVCFGVNGNATLQVNDSRYNGEDATAFKAHMNGVYLVYELATPTSETADAFENPQQIYGGTEEYVDTRDVPIPVGGERKYYNGNGYIKWLPQLTSDTIDMTDYFAIKPLEGDNYISSNGTAEVGYWKEV